jgi:hypothetical protein
MRRLHRGDLSAPVLAIIVTIGVIAAGLVLMAWFWWFAPQAGKTGALQILGQPSVTCSGTTGTARLTVRNVGNDVVSIPISGGIVIGGKEFDIDATKTTVTDGQIDATNGLVILNSGGSAVIVATGTCDTNWGKAVDGVILTSTGTYSTSFTVIKIS